MSSDVKIPEWAEREAGTLSLDYVDWIGRDKVDADAEHVLASIIALALLAAERRGLEKAADHLGQMAKDTPLGHENVQRGRSTYNWLRHCEAAIRSIGEKT